MILLHIAWEKSFVQSHWSVGFCKACAHTEAIRIGEVVETTKLMSVVPIHTNIGDRFCICDYCGRAASPYSDARVMKAINWSYEEGLNSLFERCSPEYEFGKPRFSTEEEVDDLLRDVAKATSLNRIDLNKNGMAALIGGGCGLVAGPAIGAIIGAGDALGQVIIGLMIGAVGGGILGILGGGIHSTYQDARMLIERNYRKYRIDDSILIRLSAGFPRRIRRAVAWTLAQSAVAKS